MLKFHTIKYRNLLSTGNQWTEIQLDKYTDTLIIGKNGAGKSTLLDALCFALFGKAFRKINKPNLVNSINENNMMVHLTFSSGSKIYRIERGIKPNVFSIYVDNELLDKDSASIDYQEYLEKFIIKYNYRSFTQIVILGSASFVPFMQLKLDERRKIIEELLDVEIFSTMNVLNKKDIATNKEERLKNKYDIELVEHKIDLQKQNIKEHIEHDEEEIKTKQSDIENSQNFIDEGNIKIADLQKTIGPLVEKTQTKTTLESKIKKLFQLESKLEANLANVEKDIHFLCNTADCPTCKQEIAEIFRKAQVEERNLKKFQLDQGLIKLREELASNNVILDEINGYVQDVNRLNNESSKLKVEINSYKSTINSLQKQIEKLQTRKNNLEDDNQKLAAFNAELSELVKREEKLSIEKHYLENAEALLKDSGVKTNIVRQYLPIINKMINKYLEDLNLFINFNFDENFKENIKSRHRDDFVYENFSEGEKQRIDLALLFTWRYISRMKNSANSNILILDEIFDRSIDDIDAVLDILKSLVVDTNVFVISHRSDQMLDKYQNVISFEKKNNFSYML